MYHRDSASSRTGLLRCHRYTIEDHYHCIWCNANLWTLAGGGGTVTEAVRKRLDRHTLACAMWFILGNAELGWPGMAGAK